VHRLTPGLIDMSGVRAKKIEQCGALLARVPPALIHESTREVR
jgi:hypothetical protein